MPTKENNGVNVPSPFKWLHAIDVLMQKWAQMPPSRQNIRFSNSCLYLFFFSPPGGSTVYSLQLNGELFKHSIVCLLHKVNQ